MSPKLFLDTNILLDLLGEREPFYEPAAKVASLADTGGAELLMSALSFSTAYYLLIKHETPGRAKRKLSRFKIICKILPVHELVIEKALDSGFGDFEDAIQYFCAVEGRSDVLLTRNAKNFRLSELPVMTADEYIKSIGKR